MLDKKQKNESGHKISCTLSLHLLLKKSQLAYSYISEKLLRFSTYSSKTLLYNLK